MNGSGLIGRAAYAADSGSSQRRAGGGLSIGRLAWRQLAGQGGWTVAVAVALGLVVALATAVPLTSAAAADARLRSTLTIPAAGSLPITVARTGVADQSAFEAFERRSRERVEARLGRYLAASGELATLGPLDPVTLNENPPPARVDTSRLGVGYLRELADRVEFVAGGVPPDGLGGSPDIAATMSQAGADQLGLHLGDRLCMDFSGGGTRWCARVAGLWRPLAQGDLFGLGPGKSAQLVVGRYDFYRLMKLGSAGATVGRRFLVDPNRVGAGDAPGLAESLRELRDYFTRQGEGFDTGLDQAINRFDTSQRPVRLAAEVLTGSLLVMVLYAVSFIGEHYLLRQSAAVLLLKARGWPRRRIRRLLLLELGAAALVSVAAGVAVAAAVVAATEVALPAGWGFTFTIASPGSLGSGGPAIELVAAATGLVAVWVVLLRLSARAASGELRARPEGPPGRAGWRRSGLYLLAVLAGIALLGAGGLMLDGYISGLAVQRQVGSGAAEWLSVLLCIAGVALAAGAALRLPGPGRPGRREPRSVARRLAAWQLRRRPGQHRGISFLLALAVAAGTFAAVSVAVGLHQARDAAAQVALATGAATALTTAVLAFGIHFQAVARARVDEYAALLLSGLPARSLQRSVALEQRAVVWRSLVVGGLGGAGLALGALRLTRPGAALIPASAGAGVGLATFLVVLLLAGWLARRWVGRIDLGKELRVLV